MSKKKKNVCVNQQKKDKWVILRVNIREATINNGLLQHNPDLTDIW